MPSTDASAAPDSGDSSPSSPLILIFAWLAVGAPLIWGVAQTLKKALALFT